MSDSLTEIQVQLDQLRQEYLKRLAGKVQDITECWSQLSNGWDPDVLNTFHRLIHTLAGSSATFGLTKLSETACTLEQLLQERCLIAHSLSPTEQDEIQVLLLALQEHSDHPALERHDSTCPSPGLGDRSIEPSWVTEQIDALEPNQPSGDRSIELSLITGRIHPLAPNQHLVFLVEADPEIAQELTTQLSYFGYRVCSFNRPIELWETMHTIGQVGTTAPTAIMMDMLFLEGNLAATESLAAINQWRITLPNHALPLPIIFTSVRDDLTARLQAVRAGADAYFTKPININELIDKLDHLIGHAQPDPYRVLIVEDDQTVAEFHALTLQQAGMVTQVITKPMQVMQPLSEFKPDLILMDIYMPSCSGLELAAVIRQQAAYVGIPIVFLSTETNLNKQLAAMSLGGDDFLTKPIQPDHLISSVVSRAQRSASLRSLMVRDGLTGLFNHTKIKEHLAIELKRAKRQNSPLTFAMLDIDHFKQVNDTYGHPTGDRVIKSLSRLLQQRLRQTDIVGRYGGEEFAVILVDTDGVAAIEVMNRIRQSFAQVQQGAMGSEFTVTFSCGIADYPTYQDVAQISYMADQALYQAKRQGRNCVVV